MEFNRNRLARSGELHRVWLEYTRRILSPTSKSSEARTAAKRARGGGLAVFKPGAASPLVVTVETIEHGPFKETFLEIRRRRDKDVQIVTLIEVRSPLNKKVGNSSRKKFLEKQRETLTSETHLVEIDLLRGGTHVLAVPKDLLTAEPGPCEYVVSIHRYDRP